MKRSKVHRGLSDAEFSKQVLALAGGECQARLEGCTRWATHAHHVLMRSQGGLNDIENGLALCAQDHAFIHEHPHQSYLEGWLRRRFPRPGDFHYTDLESRPA